ncbi:MAG: single-stranded-DNA-specific exonuclease RecJ [Anaerolineae bacterium]
MFTRPWREPQPIDVPDALRAAVGGHPLVAETLVRRGITEPSAAAGFLDPTHYRPTSPTELPGMSRALARLTRAICAGEPICVWGDFDVDGQTATALLVSALRDLGGRISYHIPLRETEGHGVGLAALRQVIAAGARLILTCDTGVTAHAAVAYARSQRVDVIITDHHDLPETLPEAAAAIVNPKLLFGARPVGDGPDPSEKPGLSPTTFSPHPLADLPGVGVAYKLAEALYAWARRPAEVEQYLDLVALGVVADLAVQHGDTRYLLQRGLVALRRARRLGVRALLEAADLNPEHLTEEHIAFILGPRLNAAGRLADANPCVELLTTDDRTRARVIAADLEALNSRRRLLCDQVERSAEAQIADDRSLLDDPVLVLANPHWPAGVIGIVASRLVEKYGRPVILISAPAEGVGRASARSVEGLNITAAIAAHADLLLGFGGHPMAAGFTIQTERIPEFRRALARAVASLIGGREPEALIIHGRLPLRELSLALVDDLGRLAPFGPGNPPPVLMAERVQLLSSQTVGRNETHRLLVVADETGAQCPVIWWEGGSEEPPEGIFDLAYIARASSYRGTREIEVALVAWRPSPGAEAAARVRPTIEVTDYRQVANPHQVLAALAAEADVVVWREAEAAAAVMGYDRWHLPRGQALAIWTIPPGLSELRAALTRVQPTRVYLFANDPGMDQPQAFLRRLAGLVKYALHSQAGRVTLAELAASTAQRQATVEAGLAWLAGQGHVHIAAQTDKEVVISAGDGIARPQAEQRRLAARLEAALAETAAYRAYYRTADPNVLLPIK